MPDRPTRPSPSVGAVLDAVLLVLFAALGRQTHAEAWSGAFRTAAPFLVGAVLGWTLWWVLRRTAPVDLNGGVVVWLCAVVGGMALRALTGQGTAWTFVVVTLVVTGVLLLGWRLIARVATRRRATAQAARR